jgi:ATP-binding cassette subfamily F protein 2
MPSAWAEKQNRKAEFELNKMLDTGGDSIDFEGTMKGDIRDAAMGKGEEELFEKKLSKEEKKALAKAKREAKKKEKGVTAKSKTTNSKEEEEKKTDLLPELLANMTLKERKRAMALDDLAKNNIIVNYEAKSSKLHANAKDINIGGVSVTFHGKPILEDTEIVINYGNRYGKYFPHSFM